LTIDSLILRKKEDFVVRRRWDWWFVCGGRLRLVRK